MLENLATNSSQISSSPHYLRLFPSVSVFLQFFKSIVEKRKTAQCINLSPNLPLDLNLFRRVAVKF